ncbi:23S rRNA (cytidine1920-2'-O)/16S rRNA (cytidine1409-2'-O)-methyltransferase [Nocardioides perillae]|uniref:23S rRNA (Cytidine1920-2'-O)/16S rRNA (Cytidine1409-2'-O)-methyltransferase n=1 Tax=Nocardioides perillae TaxID=1119534 RepID=A0A7Y9RWM7_9ACTN|nr:23S rRNA (cytidine1920-2'-O)/16S rRNA (cytidine1409-2'-O)-methyltransferase [Nocardioides perillae]
MAPRRLRLDAELVRRGLARSREHASELVAAGRVTVQGARATKPATAVTTDVALVVRDDPDRPDYVSRGGHKLAGALAAFAPLGLAVAGRRALDAGASTGGFTDVLLRHGAREVLAVDVGYGQLAWRLRQDPRVLVHDRTNVRELGPALVDPPVDLVVGDLSFISLLLVLDALLSVTAPDGDLALMVKPQFEVGKERVGKGGVVRDPALRAEAVLAVVGAAEARGWGARAVTTSPLPGPSGNVEFFVWLRRGPAGVGADEVAAEVARDPATLAPPAPAPLTPPEPPAGSGGGSAPGSAPRSAPGSAPARRGASEPGERVES